MLFTTPLSIALARFLLANMSESFVNMDSMKVCLYYTVNMFLSWTNLRTRLMAVTMI
jgi:hypothetical protein